MKRKDFIKQSTFWATGAGISKLLPNNITSDSSKDVATNWQNYPKSTGLNIKYAFSKDGKECIIQNSSLLRPWLNRLSNDVFFTWITQNGFIESYLLDPVSNGLVNPQEVSGHFYIKDNQTGQYFTVNKPEEGTDWKSTIGLGYNKLYKEKNNLETEVTYFIPRHDNLLLIKVKVRNTSNKVRHISIFGQVQWNLGDPAKTITYKTDGKGGSQHNLYKKAYFENNIMYGENDNYIGLSADIKWPYIGYFTTDKKIHSYETQIQNFIGQGRDFTNPIALEKNILSDSNFWSYDEYPLGVLEVNTSIDAGKEYEVLFMLGMERNKNLINKIVKKYSNSSNTDLEFKRTKEFYTQFINNTLTIETPDKENDRIINIWSKYQWRQSLKKKLDSKDSGIYGAGLWAYGLEGGSLSLFPEISIMPLDPVILKKSIRDVLLKNQIPGIFDTKLFLSPGAMNDQFTRADWENAIKNNFKVPHDHKIWGFLGSIYFYLLETCDLEFLNETVPYIDDTKATVFDHIEMALSIIIKGIDERGMYLIPEGVGDWNDELTKVSQHGRGESVMLGMEIAYFLKGFSEIADLINRKSTSEKWLEEYKKIKNGINKYAWDGNWYIRAFADSVADYQPVGSHKNEEGKIYLNSQSWSILSGVASTDRAEKTIDSLKNYLSSKYGALIFWPSYTRYVDYIGTQSIYNPGFRNGNIYPRPAGWAIIAAAMMDEAELANKLYNNSSLAVRSKDIDTYLLEPYVYAENYIGPDNKSKGEAQFHWCLGEGTSWMWYAYVNYILGVRAELNGLRIDPKIPKYWKSYKVKKSFRGSEYYIDVSNPDNVSSGVKSISINGVKVNDTLIKPSAEHKTYNVKVIMG